MPYPVWQNRLMEEVYVRTGTLRDGRSVSLDEILPLSAGRVRVTIEAVPTADSSPNQIDLLDGIWERQRARGHCPPPARTVAEEMDSERAAWR